MPGFRWLDRIKKTKKRQTAGHKSRQSATSGRVPEWSGAGGLLSADLEQNLQRIKRTLDRCSDVVYREFAFAQMEKVRLVLIYVDGLADKSQISDQIMRALALEVPMAVPGRKISRAEALEFIKRRGLCMHQVKEADRLEDVVEAVLGGDTALLVDGHPVALINGSKQWEKRAITDPEAEPTVRGSRESFIESLRTNTAMVRRRIRSPALKIETLQLGELSRTDVALLYIEGLAEEKLVEELKRRLSRIRMDAVLESGYIEELIEDSAWSPFPTVNHTEKPDHVAAMLLEGRAAILTDGTPFALTVPNLFIEYLQASEDYYERFIFTSAVRVVRFIALLVSLMLPSIYIAVVSYHHELFPSTLLLSIAAQREAVPFPVFVEAVVMELTFEVLREAGIRLPRPIGQAVSIVGALVIGEAAVRAGFVGAATVIVVAFTGIASFVFAYSASIAFRLLRFTMMAFSAVLGLFGLISGVAVIGIHLCSLRSFGVPYLYPLAPAAIPGLKDTAVRAPLWAMLTRPRLIARDNQVRQGRRLKPEPPPAGPKGGKG